jgi:hypothetical protein
MDGSAKKSAHRLMVDISDHGQTKVTASADALLSRHGNRWPISATRSPTPAYND